MADVLTAKIDAQGLKIREMKVPVYRYIYIFFFFQIDVITLQTHYE